MNKLFTLIYVLTCLSLHAQDCKISAGTKTLYKQQQYVYTKPPAGYEPVFVNHVGRHGARHLTKSVGTYFAYKLLMKADSLHALTDAGERLKQMVLMLRDIEAPYVKSISEKGKEELQGIAARMVANNKNIYGRKPLAIHIDVTKEIRTSQSADAFLIGIKQTNNALKIDEKINDTALRFYDLSPAYLNFEEKGQWKIALSSIQAAENIETVFENFSSKFFSKDLVISPMENEDFCKDIYGFAIIVNSIIYESEQAGNSIANLNFRSFFSCDQLILLSKADEAEDFLLKGPGEDTIGIQVKIAVPLLVQFINTTDKFIQGNNTSLQLRFAHAETIAPFAALMQIQSASRYASNVKGFSELWKAEEIIPLSANIQWIFYQKKNEKDLLIKFLLNEKEVQIKGLSSKNFPFYKWNDVREFYMTLLKKLHVKLNDNMGAYLLNLE